MGPGAALGFRGTRSGVVGIGNTTHHGPAGPPAPERGLGGVALGAGLSLAGRRRALVRIQRPAPLLRREKKQATRLINTRTHHPKHRSSGESADRSSPSRRRSPSPATGPADLPPRNHSLPPPSPASRSPRPSPPAPAATPRARIGRSIRGGGHPCCADLAAGRRGGGGANEWGKKVLGVRSGRSVEWREPRRAICCAGWRGGLVGREEKGVLSCPRI
jgi:hypothetical protein